jgi:hypothetical protein
MMQNKLSIRSDIPVLQRMLEFGNYQAEALAMDQNPKLQHLMVGPIGYLNAEGDEDPERALFVDLAWVNDLYQTLGRPVDAYTDSLQFFVVLPFEIPEQRQTDICLLISAYNLLLPLGNLLVDPQGQAVMVYRLKTSHDRDLAGYVVLEVLDQMLFFVNLLARQLEAVAMGRLSVDQARERTEKDLANMP